MLISSHPVLDPPEKKVKILSFVQSVSKKVSSEHTTLARPKTLFFAVLILLLIAGSIAGTIEANHLTHLLDQLP